MANETGLDFSDQIISLENKYQQVWMTKMTFHLLKEKKVFGCLVYFFN